MPYLVANGLALVLICAGVLGLTAPESVPQLGSALVAWGLIGVGILIDVVVGALFVMTLRKRRSAR